LFYDKEIKVNRKDKNIMIYLIVKRKKKRKEKKRKEE